MASSVTIDFNANLARFSSQIDKATNDLAKFETNAQRMAGNVKSIFATLGIGLGVTALAGMVKQSISFADEMGKAAQKVGTTTEALSGLKYAGDLAGVSFEGLQTGMQKLARNADEAASGSKSAVEAFARIKLDPTQFKDTSDLFAAVAEKLSQLPDGAQKTAIAMDLLGKSGADLIPLLNGGADGLKRMADEAQAAGIVISGDAAKAAEQFNDNMLRMQEIGRGISQQLVNDLTPAMADISEAMLAAAKDGGILNGVWVALGGTMAHILGMDIASKTKARLDDINKQIAISQKQLAAGSLNPDGASDRFFNFLIPDVKLNPEAKRKLQSNLDSLLSERDQLLESLKPPKLPEKLNNFEVAPPVEAPKPGGKKGATKSVSDFWLEDMQLASKQLEEEQKDLEKAMLAVEEAIKAQAQAWADLNELQQQSMDFELEGIEQAAASEQAHIESLNQRAQAYRELLDPELKLLDTQAELNEMVEAGILSSDEAAAAIAKMGDAAEKSTSMAKDLGMTFSSAFEDAIVGGEKFSDVLKGLEQDIMRILVRRTVTEPLSEGIDGLISSSGVGDWFSSIFDGFRAGGGSVSGGKAYVVGERGPELFMPGASGTIIPNGAGSSGGVVVNLIESPGNGGQVAQSTDSNGNITMDIFVEQISQKLARDVNRGAGPLTGALEGTYGLNRAVGAYR